MERWTRGSGRLAAAVCLAVLTACQPEREEAPVAEPGAAAVPADAAEQHTAAEQEMRATLENLVQAQTRYHDDHRLFAPETAILMQEYDFRPVGDATVTISFSGTEPALGYLATAVHPIAPLECTVYHGRPAADQPQFTGGVTCQGV